MSSQSPPGPPVLPGGPDEQDEFQCGLVPPSMRKSFCLLVLSLVQGTDLSLSALVSKVLDGAPFPLRALSAWQRHLVHVLREDVGGLVDVMRSFERAIEPDQHSCYAYKGSVAGE